MSDFKTAFSPADLREWLNYDLETGVATWRERSGSPQFNGRFAGKAAGKITPNGYLQISLSKGGKTYYAYIHRIVYVMVSGFHLAAGEEIDHLNGIKTDNRWFNLRTCTRSQNQRNMPMHSDNVSGFKGVCREPKTGKFMANISLNGRTKYLGLHATAEKAAEIYDAEALKHFGDFARTNVAMGLLAK